MLEKIAKKYGNWKFQQQAEKVFNAAKWELDPLNEEGGNVRLAADLYWLAIYTAEKSGNESLTNKLREGAVFYGSYDPLKNGSPQIQELARIKAEREYREEEVNKIITLERMSEERLRLCTEETRKLALEYHAKALGVAKNLNDPEILQKVKDRFNEVSKEVYK